MFKSQEDENAKFIQRLSILDMCIIRLLKNTLKISLLFVFAMAIYQPEANALRKRSKPLAEDVSENSQSHFTYDLSGSSGTQNNVNYTEVTLGLNWFLSNYFVWRNSVFNRFGTNVDSVSGLDSSARLMTGIRTDGGGLGIDLFLGPGVRLASRDNNAGFAEGGIVLTLGGLQIGGGAKYLSYFSTRTDTTTGLELPKNETQYFIVLSGGGSF